MTARHPSVSPARLALVTGAAGFIGRHAARALARDGWEVHGIGHGGWPAEEWRAWGLVRWIGTHVVAGALDAWGETPALVVHCAGGASVAMSMERPGEDFERTVASTAAVLDYLRRRAPASRLVLPSSAAVYGSTGLEPAKETRPPRPESVYGFHKLQAERICTEYGRFYGIATAAVRLFSVLGEGLRKQLLWDACGKLSRGERVFSGTGDEARDWVHVEDAVDLLVRAAEHATAEGLVVNGGTGVAATVREIVCEVASAIGSGEPAFLGSPRPGDPQRLIADPQLAQRLGWLPRTGWRDAVRRYCEWYRSVTR